MSLYSYILHTCCSSIFTSRPLGYFSGYPGAAATTVQATDPLDSQYSYYWYNNSDYIATSSIGLATAVRSGTRKHTSPKTDRTPAAEVTPSYKYIFMLMSGILLDVYRYIYIYMCMLLQPNKWYLKCSCHLCFRVSKSAVVLQQHRTVNG